MEDFDELRPQAKQKDKAKTSQSGISKNSPKKPKSLKNRQNKAKKMTAAQTFVISALVFVFVLIAGFFVMLLTGSMVLH